MAHGSGNGDGIQSQKWRYMEVPDYLFVTGKLAARALGKVLQRMEPRFDYDIAVLNCSVAGLMTAPWIANRLNHAKGFTRIMIPGLCQGNLSLIEEKTGVPAVRGPNDLKDLPVFFGGKKELEGYGEYRVKIIAEIVDAHLMTWEAILDRAEYYGRSGADIIDLGCPLQGRFKGVQRVVKGLKKKGFCVSLDTFDPETILCADKAGLDLLLSVNSRNLDLARKIRARVVVIPDFDGGMESLERNIAKLEKWGVSYIIDPILDPLCFGFTESIKRFSHIRKQHPRAEILMGLGNLTELIDVDSAGVNVLMAGVITELEIDYVLTTEVISWTRGAVRELDLARRLMHYAHDNRILPKRIDNRLIALKDPPYEAYTEPELRWIQKRLKDRNYRIFTDHKRIFAFNRDQFISGDDPQVIFLQMGIKESAHAFYLGRELEKAGLAIRLGKKYIQDQGLRWGYLDEGSEAV